MLDLTQHATDGIHRGIDMNGYVTLEDRGIGTPRIPMDNQTYTSVIFVRMVRNPSSLLVFVTKQGLWIPLVK
jgi:hypothetical protein